MLLLIRWSCRWVPSAMLAVPCFAGLTSAIVHPLHAQVMTGITGGGEVLAGIDSRCKRWMKRCRALEQTRAA